MATVTDLVATLWLLVTLSSAQTYYNIIPNESTPCPTSPSINCLTLTQYAQLWFEPVPPASADSSVVLNFVPGVHTLDTILQIQNVSSLVLQVDSSSNTELVAMVMCTNFTGFRFEDISEISVSGVFFSDCRENSIGSIDQLRMEDCSFQTGHGIELNDIANATFERSTFLSLTASTNEGGGALHTIDSNMFITECHFEQNVANVGDGGAIQAEGGNITIHNSEFNNNIANDGGVIWTVNVDITINGSNFTNNTAMTDDGGVLWASQGGNITIYSSNFINNGAADDGGVFRVSRASNQITVAVTGSTFNNNTAADDGGVLWASNDNINIIDCSFDHNMASDQGGVLWTVSDYTTIVNSNFNGNSAGDQGGIIWTSFTRITTTNSTFSSNIAADDGGVIYTSSSSINIYSSNFTNNIAQDTGGVIHSSGGTIIVWDSFFNNNTADVDGGAIRTFSATIEAYGSDFSSNTAAVFGGAIHSSEGDFITNASVFSNNGANENGGAIYTISGSVTIHDAYFCFNSANDDGGAIWTDSGRVSMINATFSDNGATDDGGVIRTDSGSVSISDSNFSSNTANNGGIVWISSGSVTISDSTFNNNTAIDDGGVLRTSSGNISINNGIFRDNKASRDGGTLRTSSSNVVIRGSSFVNGSADRDGGVLDISSGDLEIYNSYFVNNKVDRDGGIVDISSGDLEIYDSYFVNNKADRDGGVVDSFTSNYIIHNSDFSNNAATRDGGVIDSYSGVFDINNSDFSHNTAGREGGAMDCFSCTLNIRDANFFSNTADRGGGAVQVSSGSITSSASNFSDNTAEEGGAIWISSGTINIEGIRFTNNTASTNGGAIFLGTSSDNSGAIDNAIFDSNYAVDQGGALYLESRTLYLNECLLITNNSAMTGVVYALQSTLFLSGNTTVSNNKASFYASESNVTFNGYASFMNNSHDNALNSSVEEGGALTAFQSKIVFDGTVVMMHNAAINGSGGAILAFESRICTDGDTTITNNTALMGGGIYANESNLNFKGRTIITDNFETSVSDQQEIISSESVRVCFCTNGEPDCDSQPPSYYVVQKGETFSISLATVDQDGNPTPSSIRAILSSNLGGLANGQYIQNTSSDCTELNFTITSPLDSEQLVLYVDGGTSDDQRVSETRVDVTFLPCTCPVGFIRSSQQSICICECDPCLYPEYVSDCSLDNSSVQIRDDVWISYLNNGEENQSNNCPYAIHSNCPLDYCLSHTSADPVWVNLNSSIGPNTQCAFNRTGKLCGACEEGLSLTLGISGCMECSNDWLALLIVFAIAGVALVAFLLVCNLTVAVGTINGLIFYANILKVDRVAFFPFQTPNFFTIFIAWLNLDFGFVTCFYNGMDSYDKEWLQLVFPVYAIIIASLVVVACKYSKKIATLFTFTNPLAVLSTVILLSNVKYFRIVQAAWSSTSLENLDGSRESVWRIDANVPYLEGKHIALFVLALVIFFLGIAYALFLFSYQWIFHCQNKTMLKLMKSLKWNQFMDTYHAPYNMKHRYWTGLLLLIRDLLYIVAALNISGNPTNNLVSIATVSVFIFLLKLSLPCRIYKAWPLDALENSFIFNLILFSLYSLYIGETGNGNQTALAYTSTAIAFITFLVILMYHTYAFLLPKKLKDKLDSFKPNGMFNKEKSDKETANKQMPSKQLGTTPEKVSVDETGMETVGVQEGAVNIELEVGPTTSINN